MLLLEQHSMYNITICYAVYYSKLLFIYIVNEWNETNLITFNRIKKGGYFMKKFVVLFISILILLSGCGTTIQPKEQEIQTPTASIKTTPTISPSKHTENVEKTIPLKDLPKDYPLETAVANGDYVRLNGEISNNNAMNDFLKKVSSKESASVRTVLYTIEGDPIITDFLYENSRFKVIYDATRDKFGGGSRITSKTYKNLVTYQDEEKLIYYLTDLDKITTKDYENGFDGDVLKFDDISK